jgi:hypothetical protein
MVNHSETKEENPSLLDPKRMDGPVIRTTVNDIFQSNPKLYLTYHVVSAGWDLLNPVGVLLGGGIYQTGLYRGPFVNIYQMMGTTGFLTGSIGIIMGGMALRQIAAKGDAATPIPYNDDGVQQRMDGLRHNYKVRLLDLCAWSGIVGTAGLLVIRGGPAKLLSFQSGLFGTIQALSFGSAMGSFVGMGCIAYQSYLDKKDDDGDET